MYTTRTFHLYKFDSVDDNNNDSIIMSITSGGVESPLLIGDTYRELSKNNIQKSPIGEIKIKSYKDGTHLGCCLDLASVRGSFKNCLRFIADLSLLVSLLHSPAWA